MRQALTILERTAILAMGVALSAGAQAPPSKPSSAPPSKPAAAPAQTPTPAKAPAVPAAPPKSAAAAKPATQAKAPAAKPAPAAQKPKAAPAPPAKKETKKAAKAPAPKKEEAAPVAIAAGHRRDPFLALVSAQSGAGAPVRLPPGKAGLQVSTLRVEGVVRSPSGMLVVATNPQNRTYFLHQGDRLFDGRVEQISMDAVTFQETGKDPFGKPIDRTVVKRIYPSVGEQQ